jgi:general secretion pathway protein D
MKPSKSLQQLGGLILGLCLASATQAYAQQRTTGGGGGAPGGGGGGFGGFGGGGGGATRSSGASGGTSGAGGSIYPNSTQVGTVGVSVDPNTGTVAILTDDDTYENKVKPLIESLDRPKPQVLIKVVFLEVTHSDDLDFGVEGSYNKSSPGSFTNIFTGTTALGKLFTNTTISQMSGLPAPYSSSAGQTFGLAQQGGAGSTIGPTTMPFGAGLYSIAASDFNVTVRAIASASKVDVLSRPSIMVRNNQPATITVGQSVPLVNGVTFQGVAGIPVSTVTYQNVGIILQVTPFITADGLVEMIVSPQISSLSTTTVQIATNVNVPVINLRSASTVVITPDGQTVIIGGLMETDKTVIDTKIPILGDIPGLGLLFRHKQKDNTKTELLIFLTPHVVTMPSQAAAMSGIDAKKTEIAPKAFTEQELNKFFDTLPLKPADTSVKH